VRLLKLESAVEFGLVIMECPRGQCLQRIVDTLALPLMHRVLYDPICPLALVDPRNKTLSF